MRFEKLGRQVDLLDVGYVLELQLLVILNLELRSQVICSKVELDLGILVAGDSLLLVDYGIGEAGVERLLEDTLVLAVAAGAVEVEVEAVVRAGDPYNPLLAILQAGWLRSSLLTIVEIHGDRFAQQQLVERTVVGGGFRASQVFSATEASRRVHQPYGPLPKTLKPPKVDTHCCGGRQAIPERATTPTVNITPGSHLPPQFYLCHD